MSKKAEFPFTFDVAARDILKNLFTEKNLRRTIRRMRAWQETENEVAHPLRKPLLIEYEESLAEGLAAAVSTASWAPSPSYLVLTAKRTGTYREMAYPPLIDTLVGRVVIDALEPHVTRDDNDRVFFGRSHANADRQRGDYENWFKVWLDYSSQITKALESDGYTYVFDTDVTQFFPSVDRARAKEALARRTQAHQTLLELLFYCLEAWAPRVRYCSIPGLPIEPNDVSRLVAHNFIKGVDEHFVDDPGVEYLRWVDDTVMFVKNEKAAEEVKRRHHLALRELGLSPNAAKTSILRAKDYGAARHPDFNRRINEARDSKNGTAVEGLVDEWMAKDAEYTPSWDKVATRLYSLARQVKSEALRNRCVTDICTSPRLVRPALKYLSLFELSEADVGALLDHYGKSTTSVAMRIELARFLGDARVGASSDSLAQASLGNVLEKDKRLGSGYARALSLLCLNKHGGRSHREKVREALSVNDLQDDQLRLHYLYVFRCRGELPGDIERAVRHLDTPDIALTMRLCSDVAKESVKRYAALRNACLVTRRGVQTVEARSLPLLHLLLRSESHRADNVKWLTKSLEDERLQDATVRRFLEDERNAATR